ncbi:MAG TPA: ATP-binding protein [Kofleriaceae bacterium]|jgi:serine/threonine-protein kinase RsbW|nr:ATP-binding protein [Kofleriaceae bacterium]
MPGSLRYRAIAVRVVAEACRLISRPELESDAAAPGYDLTHPFDSAVVSAFAEIFNNIAIHAYGRRDTGLPIDLALWIEPDGITIELRDQGSPFEIADVPTPSLDELHEGGMGIHIARSLLDRVEYEPGPPNLWRLYKRLAVEEARPSVVTR